MKFVFTAQAGGVESTITEDFDYDKALEREKRKVGRKIARELAQYITISEPRWSGDYKQVFITLNIPNE